MIRHGCATFGMNQRTMVWRVIVFFADSVMVLDSVFLNERLLVQSVDLVLQVGCTFTFSFHVSFGFDVDVDLDRDNGGVDVSMPLYVCDTVCSRYQQATTP